MDKKTKWSGVAVVALIAGATNAGLLAIAIVSGSRPGLREQLRAYRQEQTQKVRQEQLP